MMVLGVNLSAYKGNINKFIERLIYSFNIRKNQPLVYE